MEEFLDKVNRIRLSGEKIKSDIIKEVGKVVGFNEIN